MFEPRPDIRIATLGFVILGLRNNVRGEKRDHYLVMSDKRESAAAAGNRAPHDIRQRAILLYEIEVRCVETLEPESKVANDGHCLQENLRQHYCRPEIQVDAAAV